MPESNRIKLAFAILFLQFVLGSAVGVQRTVLTIYSKEFIQSALIAFLPIISFGLFKGIVSFLGGIISDKIGRRLSMITGTLIYIIGIYLILYFENLESLIIGNILIGAGEGLNHIASMASLSDILRQKKQPHLLALWKGLHIAVMVLEP